MSLRLALGTRSCISKRFKKKKGGEGKVGRGKRQLYGARLDRLPCLWLRAPAMSSADAQHLCLLPLLMPPPSFSVRQKFLCLKIITNIRKQGSKSNSFRDILLSVTYLSRKRLVLTQRHRVLAFLVFCKLSYFYYVLNHFRRWKFLPGIRVQVPVYYHCKCLAITLKMSGQVLFIRHW